MDKYSNGTRNTQQTNTHQINHTTVKSTDKTSDNNKSHRRKRAYVDKSTEKKTPTRIQTVKQYFNKT
jgi:hypothetical protein